MTLYETIKKLEEIALAQHAVEQVVANDVFRLNTLPDAKYGVFAWVQRQHQLSGDLHHFRFYLYYVDRLTEDKGNEVEVQSTGVEVLTAIVRGMEEIGIGTDGDVMFTTFNQRFMDECAGTWCEVSFIVPDGFTCV